MMGFCGMCVAFSTRPSDRTQIWHACADRYPHLKKWTHPTPGGFRGLSIVKILSRRTAPKFGTHVRIDTLTLKNVTHPTPGGCRGLNCLARLALARERTPSVSNKYNINSVLFVLYIYDIGLLIALRNSPSNEQIREIANSANFLG